jgi:hypothetical protein
MTADAEEQSRSAEGYLQQIAETIRGNISEKVPKEIREMEANEMVDLLKWEFEHLPLIHNGEPLALYKFLRVRLKYAPACAQARLLMLHKLMTTPT